ncbi:Ser/Thr protein phosphatase superfamily protein [Nannizzia gypsea CBS 118893]|uniref:Ser/Thr protein phosphatase superfamily protein n=1 Tax=Arthroderma gypseum (strain ATCC MYA-4604 / CBS 118893) TaxID=535722 RepID=E4V3E1_ARTGP|nr:Ser/Thr protein phosphatase superfamily protein [Nannizzia gypsea CBS 118893]EFR04515.1 Ser/Thr protein phosphatase superfamily protein [Nannizzia gypsea CBS 118893]
MSDLHLEVGQQYADFRIKPRASQLILAGDIGRLADYDAFRDFLCTQCGNFEAVYLVLGNHEFFGVTRQEGLRLADQLQEEPQMNGRLVILNQKRVDIGNTTILGCTLHSHVLPGSEQVVASKINDFRCIKDWTVASHNAEHAADVKWLKDEISSLRSTESESKRKLVVVTHHAPSTSKTSKASDEGNPWSSAFGTDLLDGTQRSCLDHVNCWIYGHTHYSSESIRGQVRLVSNQRGYVFPGQSNQPHKSPGGIISKFLGSREHVFDVEKVVEI